MTDANIILPSALVVDLSHWQGRLSKDQFQQARQEGSVVGVISKLMQGGEVDHSALDNLYNAWEANIPLLGIYDFGTADDDSHAFLDEALVEFNQNVTTRLLALDAEKSSYQMTVANAEGWVSAIKDAENRYPVLYMGRDGPDGTGADLPSDTLSQCDLWLPAYGPHVGNLSNILPPGFRLPQSDTDRGGCLRLWQFTDGTVNGGPVPGLGRVDQSYFVGFSSLAAATAWWGT